ncbi:uncharacterized protein LOC121977508 [Zingiber officinale]|uniref:uncharacterized protein LOC121977508 n=1 Tax=Zingiber officinale TaxID=94328 RepID=UPI001C4DBC51|nr:uncharacterized protein LOC121977508 [Zingiber officinale]
MTPFPRTSATNTANHRDSTPITVNPSSTIILLRPRATGNRPSLSSYLLQISPSIALPPTQSCPNTSPPLLQHSSLEAEIPPPNREKMQVNFPLIRVGCDLLDLLQTVSSIYI